MCIRREAIQQAGLLDEAYHMYVEEVDWSRRIRLAGWEAYCVPAAVVTHLGGAKHRPGKNEQLHKSVAQPLPVLRSLLFAA